MIREQFEKARRDYTIGFLDGAEAINNSYASHAGNALREGDGSIMSTYRKNKSTINELRLEVDNEILTPNQNIKSV